MADNLIDVPDDNLIDVPTPTMREGQRAFKEQIRMGAPEQPAQMSAGQTNIAIPPTNIAIPPQPETIPSLERDEQGNMVIVNKPYTPVGDTRKGIFKRMTESAKDAFGNEPPGISPENLKKYPYLNVLQPFAGMADIALRDINSAMAGGAGAVAGLAENLGMSEAEANRLQRDIYHNTQVAGTGVPTPTVGMMTKPVVRKGPPSPPTVETINFIKGKPPVEPPPQLPIISYAEGAIVPEVRGKGARLLPSETPHEPIALPPRAGVGAEAAVGPLDGVSPEAINQVARDLKEDHFTPYTLDDRLEKMSPHQFLAEATENLETEAGKIAAMGGEARNTIVQNFDQRHSEIKQRLKSSYDSAFGPVENLAQERKTLTIDQKAAADKFYKKFRELEIYPTDELKELMPRLEAAGAFGEAKKIAAVEGFPWEESFFTTGTRKNYPTAESWDYVKRALDTKIEGSFNQFGEPTNWTRIYTELKNKLVGSIDNHPNPEVSGVWKEARDTYAGPARIKNSYELGKKILSDAVDANEVPFLTASHSTKELEAIAQGIRYNLENQLGKAGPQEGRSIRQMISDNAQNKIRWIIGDEKAEKLFNSIDLENQMYGAPTRIYLGSATSKRVLGAVEKYGPKPPRGAEALGTIVETGVNLLKEPKKTITKTVSKFVTEKMARTAEEKAAKLRADIAHIYTLQGPERDVAVRWILEHGEGFKGTPTRATGGSVFDKMHMAKHMQQGGELSSFLEGEYSGNKQGQHGGGYLGIESPTWNAGIGGQGWREKTPEGPLGSASITNVDVGHKIGDLNLTGSYRANQREIARPPAGGNTYFDPIEHSGKKFRMPNNIDQRFTLKLSKPFSDGGSVLDKMHMARKRAEGGGTDVPFNEWDAVPRNAEGIPQIRIEKPPVNEADEAQAAREAAAARVAGNVRGAPYEPTPPSTEGKTWLMEPGKEAVQSGNYENTLPPNVRLNDAGIPYNVETGKELQMARRPSFLPLTRTPYGVQLAMPKAVELAGDIVNPLAVTKGVALNPGEFALGSGPIKRAVLEQPNAPTFYSALDRAVTDIPQTKASAEQWAATLANRPGVKPEEIQWRGLDQYLAGRAGQTVTKQEIADHLAGNKVELGSVAKGGDNLYGDNANLALNEYRQKLLDKYGNGIRNKATPEELKTMEDLDNRTTMSNPNPTKYHSYQLPGGENYSEKLMTLPYERQIKWEKTPEGHLTGGGYTIKHEPFQDKPAYITYYGNDGRRVSGNDSLKGAQNLIERSSRGVDASEAYKSPHWDEPNPVTHMRTNERTIGNTASHHIEEVQSDWHQKGRTEGYRGEPTDKAVEEKASSGFDQAWRGGGKSWETAAEDERKIWRENTRARMIEKGDGVPDAPFKKTWPDLTMKQALRDAVENGKDRLSWTPGEAQAKRYDLSQHVKEIEYVKNSDGTYRVGIADKDGEPIRSLPGIDVNRMTMAQIEATVGKEIAVKIENGSGRRYRGHDGHTLEGLDLKVGGEGMNEFYNKMLPKAVEKLGKAYGVKVQRGVDTTGNPVNYVDIPPAWEQEILKKGFPLFSSGGSVFDKMHAAKHMQEGGGLESFIKSLGSQGAAFGTQTEQEQAGHQRDPISELGKGAYNAVEHLDAIVGEPSRQMKSSGYPAGSEEDDYLNAGKRRDAMYWGPDMALNMVGIGGPLAMTNAGKNAIGIAGGRGVKSALPAVSIKKLERSLDRSGVRVDESKGSNLSSSAYLEATIPDWSGYKIGPLPEDATRTVKVRAADHDLPPTYKKMNGRADIEIGPHGDAAGSWHDAASYIFKEGGIRPDPITKRVLNAEFAKRDAAQSARAVAEEARAAEGAHAASRADDAWRGILREYGIPETFEREHNVYNTKTMRRQLEQWKKSAATDANSEFGKLYNPFVRYGITKTSGGSVFDKMHAAKHMQEGGGLESFIKSLGSQGAAFGTQTEQEQAGHQRDPISELGKGAYNAVEHLAKENIDNANLLATGNRDQFSGKPGFEAGMLTMGTGAVAGVPMRAGEAVLGAGPIRAYHSSPHDFDKFDLAKIGTGEGAQAYGHGIYTAESQAVSGRGGQYDKQFTQRMRAGADSLLAKNGGDVAAAEAAARAEIERLNGLPLMGNDPKRWASLLETQQNRLAALDTFKRTGEFPKSHIYEVNINADPNHFLDWDKPFAQQGGNVQEAINNLWTQKGGSLEGRTLPPFAAHEGGTTGDALHSAIATTYGRGNNSAMQAAATDALKGQGIPGIKYLDQGSRQFSADAFAGVQRAEAKIERLRASGETGYKLDDALQELQSAKRSVGDLSSNYVVFDPKIIEIMKKYGMTLPAATAAYEAMKTDQEKTGFKKGGSVFDKMKRASK